LAPPQIAAALFHWLEYAGLIGTIGSMVVRRLGAQRPRVGWARPPMHYMLAVALAGGLALIVVEAFVAGGSASGAASFLVGSPAGWVRLARVVAEGAALFVCVRGMRMVAPLALFATASLAFAGHSASVQPPAGAIFTDAIHVLSAGVWAGGIVALATLKPPGGWGGEESRALLGRFARVAPLAFAMTALTGIVSATSELNGPGDLWATPYGLVLSAKSAGVLLMLILSAIAFRRRLAFARVEAAVALAVLGATAVLAAYPLPPSRSGSVLTALDTSTVLVSEGVHNNAPLPDPPPGRGEGDFR
jgi:putative copper export protein